MKNTTILMLVVVAVVIVGAFFFINEKSPTGNIITDNPNSLQGQKQQVILSERNLNYYPSRISVKANQPVEITLDSSVQGCLRSFVIKDLGVSKFARTASDKITFTPTKAGTFSFACSMGMGYGTLVVE
ncbi:cupredoxin domain-containing protein [Candidatus Pacearchaeota archaeon]|nr:cupredoxin domain-containing protein [Candidatus Pacearchaeota archaeon]